KAPLINGYTYISAKRVLMNMIEKNLLYQYNVEKEVIYRAEKYLVRDNGSVCRKQRVDGRKRPIDDKWTFGKQNKQKGYMEIGSHVVHRIVAVAFLDNPPSVSHVVDHIDTNKCNNRPENLRWVTRLENIILNPITLKRIIIRYGSLDKFFENPNSSQRLEPNIDWMRTVSKEEASRCREQLLKWAELDNLPKGGDLSEWIYNTRQSNPSSFLLEDKPSLTPMAVQRNWKWPIEFPNCPSILGPNPLEEYKSNLNHGSIFTRNKYGESTVEIAEKCDVLISVLAAMDKTAVKPWSVTKITIENGKYIHEDIGSFFELNGAKKAYYKLLGIPFEYEGIDDYS
ncbi:MAG: HNH endonuclease, partial [Campylobacterales bacterium]|nr:HNH endonuclease [Campylobacterales bacterium]